MYHRQGFISETLMRQMLRAYHIWFRAAVLVILQVLQRTLAECCLSHLCLLRNGELDTTQDIFVKSGSPHWPLSAFQLPKFQPPNSQHQTPSTNQ